jgi:hypothetical protein
MLLVVVYLLLQTDASYVRELPGPLVCLYRSTMNLAESLSSSWTISEVRDIVRPLLGRKAESWTFKVRNARLWLWLLERKGLPEGMEKDKRLAKFAIELSRYGDMEEKLLAPHVKYREEATLSDEFYDEVKRLSRLKSWTEWDVQKLIAKLSGVSSIDARASSPEAFKAWMEFSDRWESFLCDHPAIAAKLQ